MTEKQWVETLKEPLQKRLSRRWGRRASTLVVTTGYRLPYACEISDYVGTEFQIKETSFETDLLIAETWPDDTWKPRVVVEAKLRRIGTHGALVYSQKALAHKSVHPYLRYGMLIGGLQEALPGRLIRHGLDFDFLLSWYDRKPSHTDWRRFVDVVLQQVEGSQTLERLMFESRKSDRLRYTVLQRPIIAKS